MNVVLVGGMDRLHDEYRMEAKRQGVDIQIFSQDQQSMCSKIRKSEGVVIFTNKVSHQARNRAVSAAKLEGVPVFMHHSCGVCSLRECLQCLEVIGRTAACAGKQPQTGGRTFQKQEQPGRREQ
jgi:hypothetical protein